MSGYIRRGECLEAVAKVNSVLTMFEERIRQIRRDMEKLEAENRALREKIQALEIRCESLSARTSGWQEGFGKSVREQFKRIDERFVKLLASDDSADFEIRQWVEEVSKLRKDFSALKERVEFIEKFKPVIVKESHPAAPQPLWPNYQPIRTTPGTGNPDSLNPPWKITCQKESRS